VYPLHPARPASRTPRRRLRPDPPELAPLANSLLAAECPLSILTWLYTRKGKTESPETLLRQLGRGQIALTHEAFHTL